MVGQVRLSMTFFKDLNLGKERNPLRQIQGGCNEAVPKPLYLMVVCFVKFDLGLSESTLTLVFPFKRCEKHVSMYFFGSWWFQS